MHPPAVVNERTEALKQRTKKFALDVLALIDAVPRHDDATRQLLAQLADAATSVAANYRAACRARSRAEFTAKLGLVLEEADESLFWLEVLSERRLSTAPELSRLLDEAGQLTAIFSAGSITLRSRHGT